MRYKTRIIALLAIVFTSSAVNAGEYDYEVGLNYSGGDSDSIGPFGSGFIPGVSAATFNSDIDVLDLRGAWYYRKLSDDRGPRARAAFLSRASSLSLQYLSTDTSDSLTATSPGTPTISSSTSTDTTAITASLRHMFANDTWFLLAGISRLETDGNLTLNGSTSSFDFDGNALSLGIGGYIANNTTVSFVIAEAESPGSDPTNIALSLSHVGQINANWHYGIDVSASRSDQRNDEGAYSLRGSLYPGNDIEFGVAVTRNQINNFGDQDSYELFGSWFVRPHIKLSAGFQDTDQGSDLISFGAAFRF